TAAGAHRGGGPERRRLAGGLFADALLDLAGQRRVLAEEVAHVFATLAEPHVSEGHPGAALLDDTVLDRGVDERALPRDALVEQDVELGRAEGRRHLVLDDLHLGPGANRVEAALDGLDLPDVEPDRVVELERAAA